MFDIPLINENVMWGIPLAFYIYDNCCLINDRQIIIIEKLWARWTFRITKIPFEIAGKHLYILPLFMPFMFAFKLQWLVRQQNGGYKISVYKKRIAIWSRRLRGFRVVAGYSFINLFIAGPLLTIKGGIMFALTFVLPLHIILLIVVIYLLTSRSAVLDVSRNDIVLGVIELTLCPGYLPNICRRLSLSCIEADVDGVRFIRKYGEASTIESLLDIIAFRLSDIRSRAEENGGITKDVDDYAAEMTI